MDANTAEVLEILIAAVAGISIFGLLMWACVRSG
jgi:hypothetical protein